MSETFRVLVTGSREFTDAHIIFSALYDMLEEHGHLTVIHGGARGADSIAARWVERNIRDSVAEEYLAEWDKYPARPGGKSPAGHIRNSVMVKSGPQIALAFLSTRSQNSGTRGCMALISKAGIPLTEFWDS